MDGVADGLARCEEYISTNEVSTKAGIKELWSSTRYSTVILRQTSNHNSLQNHANRQKVLGSLQAR